MSGSQAELAELARLAELERPPSAVGFHARWVGKTREGLT